MAEVLVLVDHVDGENKKSTFELLTAARALGEPSAVVVGPAGTAGKLAEGLKAHGAAKVYVAETDSTDFL
ncbi:MAG: electron transfer flavoprotein alpha subunit, partial [Pseudonocardiales bacterium]|nr:electron transfer flavoprotein alpha subunit [Pseudonocardiales bacterium]